MTRRTLWEFGETEWQSAGCQQEIVTEDGDHIGWIDCYEGDTANARLAVAAPALLECCQDAAKILGRANPALLSDADEVLYRLLATIKQAEPEATS